MPRNFSSIRQLASAADVVACLQEDPFDRVLHYESDLTADEFDGNNATRGDHCVLVIRSMRAIGATNMREFVNAIRREPIGIRDHHAGSIAVVGMEHERNEFGRVVPLDVSNLIDDAEERRPGSLLSWAGGYECLCVLAEHPEAEAPLLCVQAIEETTAEEQRGTLKSSSRLAGAADEHGLVSETGASAH